ncbi:MAG: cysteine desulfurase family protein [Candidatus Daviesbacteria bacterium]|nr:cysteine desulfurase family protein [Candidatus Daviesbacteria bacterium]
MKSIYLDYAATTPVDPQVVKKMQPYFSDYFGNPSEIHKWGLKASEGIKNARTQISKALNCNPSEITFTSCATESINLAHKGLIEAVRNQDKKIIPHIITTQIEHKAVLETCKHLEKLNWAKVTYLPVDEFGLISINDLGKAITKDTVLVSIMFVNNEVGSIQPIAEIGKLLKTKYPKIFFHADATQALPYFDCDVNKLNIDLLSFTGHKIYAPKGIGALFIKSGTPIIRQQDGGSQENNLRAGTESVPLIVGLGQATELIIKNRAKESSRLKTLQKNLISKLTEIPGIKLTGHPEKRAPHIASFIVKDVEGESMMLLLSDLGIAVSTGSACNSQVLSSSHVLDAMGIAAEDSHGSLRLSLGKDTTKEDIEYTIKSIKKVVTTLRKMSPDLTGIEF